MGHFSFSSRTTRTLAAALAALVLVGIWGIHLGGASAGRLEARLEVAANDALGGREHQWAHAGMNGQIATLEGRAPSDAARLDALAAVGAAEWSGGGFAGGVTEVRDATIPVDVVRDFGLRASASNGRITMTGDVDSDAVVQSLSDYARRLFPAGAEISITVDPGAETGSGAEDAARRVIAELVRLDRGTLVLAGDHAVLYGMASHGQTAASAVRGTTELPAPYQGSAYIGTGDGRFISVIADAEACELLLLAAQPPSGIRFDPGQADLVPASATQIQRMGAVLAECPATRLTVTAGPDPVDDDMTDEISLARAAAVRAALVDGGADGARIQTAYSDTQAGLIRFDTMPLEGG